MPTILCTVAATTLAMVTAVVLANFPDETISKRSWGQAAVGLWMLSATGGMFWLAYYLSPAHQ